MEYEIVDFKTIKIDYVLDPGIGADLALLSESGVSVSTGDEWSGYIDVFLRTKIHDETEQYFVFDIITETLFKVPDGTEGMTEEMKQECIRLASDKSYAAIRDMSVAMGINELDLTK